MRRGLLLGFLLTAIVSLVAGRSALAQDAGGTPHFAMGLIPDTPDVLLSLPRTPLYRGYLPDSVDLSANFPQPGDQGAQGSCVGWAVGYAARAYYAKFAEERDTQSPENIPSPAYIYDSIKAPGTCDAGAKISDALNLLFKQGAISLHDLNYSAKACSAPPSALRARATDFRIRSWQTVSTANLDQIKAELYNKNPVILSLHATASFEALKAGQIYTHPDTYLGWHAITAVGYDESKQAFKLINSWGPGWADNGFGWIGYDTLRSEVNAAYVMTVAPSSKPVPQPAPPAPPKPAPPPKPVPQVDIPHPDCSYLRLVAINGTPTVVGFVGSDADLEAVRKAVPNAEIAVDVRPWPQCEALLTLEKPITDPDAPKVSIEAPDSRVLKAGDHVVFDIVTPPYPSYLHVTYLQADGSAVTLVQPGSTGAFKAYPPRSKIVIGDEASGGKRFRVSAPFGREMLVVLAARSPIFPETQPAQETQREFLSAVRRAFLYKPGADAPDRAIVAGYDTIVTKEADKP